MWLYLFQVELTVPELPERIDSLEKTPEGMTLLEAIEAKLVYDSSEEDDDDDDDEDDNETDDAVIQKEGLKIYPKGDKGGKGTKKIVRELLMSAGNKHQISKDG